MAFNKFMHPRNRYKTQKPDFKQLAVKYDYFREKVTQNLNGKVILEFKDPASLRALTRALLEEDFGLLVSLPVDRLIPTVPLRLNYILWLEDILGSKTQVRGMDIGTGASCIYPLLGCKKNGWQFLATEVDDQNMMFATQNVEKNQLQDKIKIKKVEEDKLLLGVLEDSQTYDFSMCNPPFFSDHLEAQGITATRSDDRPEPRSVCTASEKESIAWGGEVRFVCQMIAESLILKDKIRVYTSMLGKKMSLALIKDELIKKKITQFSSTEFCQGRTMRWGIAWTFDKTLNFPKSTFKELKKPVVPLTFEIPRTVKALSEYTVQAFTEYVRAEIEELKINYHVKHNGKFYTCLTLQAKENTWSHQRRKKRREKFATMNNKGGVDSECKEITELQEVAAVTNKGVLDTDSKGSTELPELVSIPQCDQNDKKNASVEVGQCLNNTNVSADNVKELKNIHNNNLKKEQEQNKSTGDVNDVGVTSCLKRKRIDASGDASCKKCKTENENLTLDKDDLVCARDLVEESCSCAIKTGDFKNSVNGEKIKIDETCEIDSILDSVKKNNADQKLVDTSLKNTDVEHADNGFDKPETLSMNQMSDITDKQESENVDSNKMLSRPEIVKQFWAEQEANKKRLGGKKRVPHSVYEKMEAIDEKEECLVLLKLMIRKDEGVMNFNMKYLAGQKEAMHQIGQHFRNKLK